MGARAWGMYMNLCCTKVCTNLNENKKEFCVLCCSLYLFIIFLSQKVCIHLGTYFLFCNLFPFPFHFHVALLRRDAPEMMLLL